MLRQASRRKARVGLKGNHAVICVSIPSGRIFNRQRNSLLLRINTVSQKARAPYAAAQQAILSKETSYTV